MTQKSAVRGFNIRYVSWDITEKKTNLAQQGVLKCLTYNQYLVYKFAVIQSNMSSFFFHIFISSDTFLTAIGPTAKYNLWNLPYIVVTFFKIYKEVVFISNIFEFRVTPRPPLGHTKLVIWRQTAGTRRSSLTSS